VDVLGVAPENPRGFNYPSHSVDMAFRDSPWLDVTWGGGERGAWEVTATRRYRLYKTTEKEKNELEASQVTLVVACREIIRERGLSFSSSSHRSNPPWVARP